MLGKKFDLSEGNRPAATAAPADRIASRLNPTPKSWRWLLIGLSLCAALSSVAAAAFLWLLMIPPLPNCQHSSFSSDRDRLYCAQSAAESGDLPQLLAGLDLLAQWTPDHPLYRESQKWLAEWSESVLTIARRKLSHDLAGAVKIASQIPPSSPVYQEAQATIDRWQHQWQKGQAIETEARKALHAQNWDRAAAQINALRSLNDEHWRSQQATALTQQLFAEKRARAAIVQAQKIAQNNSPAALSAAVARVSQIDRKTYAWRDAQPSFNQWSESLLKHGFQQWQASKLDSSIAVARRVALNPRWSQEAQSLMVLSQARKLAASGVTHWAPSPQQIFNLMEAVSAVREIKPDSQFYPHAQASLKNWQAYLKDLKQLQVAQLTASLGHRAALEAAIDQAQQIGRHQPCRRQAQTLAAHWNQQIQRVDDRPDLLAAQKLAAPGTILALQAAIGQAQTIRPGRALRPEAQGLIYVWNQKMQTIEDQPILDRAQSLASRGRLGEAVGVATGVLPGRALYPQARMAIGNWRAEIRAIEAARAARDRAIQPAPRSQPETSPALPQLITPEVISPASGQSSDQTTQENALDPSRGAERSSDSPPGSVPATIELQPAPSVSPGDLPASSNTAPPSPEPASAPFSEPSPVIPPS